MPAPVEDRDVSEALDTGKVRWPTLREGVHDGASTAERCRAWSNRHDMRHRVVACDLAARGSAVLAGRWVVEQSFGRLSHRGGIAGACVLSGFEAPLNPMPARTRVW